MTRFQFCQHVFAKIINFIRERFCGRILLDIHVENAAFFQLLYFSEHGYPTGVLFFSELFEIVILAGYFFMYRIVAQPLSWLFLKIKFAHRIRNKKVLRGQKKPYFIYANHTSAAADPFVPTMVCSPKKVYVVVHAANVSMPVLGKINPYIGALPLPDGIEASKNFTAAMEKRLKQRRVICIYPEAHIWPYYTGIRPFTEASFRYPVRYDTPVYAFTNVYKKRKHLFTPKIITYVDGPFFPDKTLHVPVARKKLRDQVYEAMCARSKLSDYDGIIYKKADENQEELNDD